jgi:Zn-dependent metalloprotease
MGLCSAVPPYLTNQLQGMRLANAQMMRQETAGTPEVFRLVYDCGGSTRTPGSLLMAEHRRAPTHPPDAAREAWDGAGWTYKLYEEHFGRNSIDGRGMRLVNSVRYGRRYNNAFWDGVGMRYGDGDGVIFQRFTRVIDVIGHELTHGVTERTAGLEYRDEPGALNESFSDVFGSMVKQYSKAQTVDQADWIIGEGIFTDRVRGRGLRDMRNPGTAYDDPRLGKDPQPDHYSRLYRGPEDEGGVHINSGVPNKAFVLACDGLLKAGVARFAWEGAGQVWYDALTRRLSQTAGFRAAAQATIDAAGAKFQGNQAAVQAVTDAWGQVGVL